MGGYKSGGVGLGGQVKAPTKKKRGRGGGDRKLLAMLKGDTRSFEVVLKQDT